MANTIELPNLKFFQWQRPGASNPRLEVGIGLTDTTIVVSNPPLDENGDVITGDFIFGVRNNESYVENIYVPPGAVSIDGLTFTNVVRGVSLTGLDYNTSVPSLIAKHGADSPVSCNVTAVYESILAACLRGQSVRTNGINFIQGTGTNETVTISRDDGTVRGWLRFDRASSNAQYSNDGSTWASFSPGAASSLVAITSVDTSPGYLEDKLEVTSANPALIVQKNVLNPGGGEDLELEFDLATVVTSAGVGDAGKVVVTGADGKIDGSLQTGISSQQVHIYGRTSYGDTSSQFDITNPSGDTYRYIYDGNGTNANIDTHTMIIGQKINITAGNFAAGNQGTFVITNVGANFFEVTNASGVVESNKSIGSGAIGSPSSHTFDTDSVRYKVELWGAGGAGGSAQVVFAGGGGGGGGAWRGQEFFPYELSSPVSFTVGAGGVSAGHSVAGTSGGNTVFNSLITAFGGGGGSIGGRYPRGGGGGGWLSAGTRGASTGRGGQPSSPTTDFTQEIGLGSTAGGGSAGGGSTGGSEGISCRGGSSVYGGGAGGSDRPGGDSIYGCGGGGGSGRSAGVTQGGTSIYGGNGGAALRAENAINAGNGFMPGGGGGGKGNDDTGTGLGGFGGDGMVKITEYFI